MAHEPLAGLPGLPPCSDLWDPLFQHSLRLLSKLPGWIQGLKVCGSAVPTGFAGAAVDQSSITWTSGKFRRTAEGAPRTFLR